MSLILYTAGAEDTTMTEQRWHFPLDEMLRKHPIQSCITSTIYLLNQLVNSAFCMIFNISSAISVYQQGNHADYSIRNLKFLSSLNLVFLKIVFITELYLVFGLVLTMSNFKRWFLDTFIRLSKANRSSEEHLYNDVLYGVGIKVLDNGL